MSKQPSKDTELEIIVNFLCGEGELDGYWYSEKPTDRPIFWWRKKLKKAIKKEIERYTAEARIDELKNAHRSGGTLDFDNATDEYIDDRIEQLTNQEGSK